MPKIRKSGLPDSRSFGIICNLALVICCLALRGLCPSFVFAQESELEFTLDTNANTTALPKVFKPNIDLSGRGFHHEGSWPQALAAKEVVALWQKDIGFGGLYRLQYNLWEINQLAKDKETQDKLLVNYEKIIEEITNAGGTVILDIFGTPAGMGKVLDKKTPPWNLKAFKELIKSAIRELSCNKRYNIWYEVWNAPDLETFFLGRKQDYFNLYRVIAESINELEEETKIHIPLGGPSVSWWFQNVDGNTNFTPERSLIYELIKFCCHRRLPLDFISWHGYSTDPQVEKEATIYKKSNVTLIRDWLSYFNFDRNTPLIVDEWNYDRNANAIRARTDQSYICASYIPSRIKNMSEAGIDFQLYFCLEDFQNNKEGVVRNVGIFSFDTEHSEYKGGPKVSYNVLKMLAALNSDMFASKINDEFVGLIATRSQDDIAILIYNYIDPEIAKNFLSRNIATLSGAERKMLLNIIKSGQLEKIILGEVDILKLRVTSRLKALLKKAQELNEKAKKFQESNRTLKLVIKKLKENYAYSRYSINSGCSLNCPFEPVESEDITTASGSYEEVLSIEPYSVNLLVLKNKPTVPSVSAPTVAQEEKASKLESEAQENITSSKP